METDSSKPSPAPAAATPRAISSQEVPAWCQFRGMIVYTVVLLVLFGRPLFALVSFAMHSELYSHILLVPFITGYLIWINKRKLALESQPDRRMAWLPLAIGAITLAGYWIAVRKGWSPLRPDYLAAMTFSFLFFLLGGAFIFLGSNYLRKIAFPVAILFFCVPFPQIVRDGIEVFFQHGSSVVAYVFLEAAGMPVLRTGTYFQLPSFSLAVAPECSGIHSTLVLVITSLLASYLFLKTTSRRLLLVAVVIPLALLRNGFRVFVIAELCVRIGPQMIDSPIHHHGGPLFFLLSLIPLFLLLVYLVKSESRKENATPVRPKE
jgi:exosortase C (VPDSG-CTERM-specific)